MAIFNDLAVELQEAIWQLVLPYRGIHWIEIEGLPHPAPHVRDSIRFTREYQIDDDFPKSPLLRRDYHWMKRTEEHRARRHRKGSLNDDDNSGAFFQKLWPTVPSVWGEAATQAGPPGEGEAEDQDDDDLADEVAYTRRCRQLSTYTQLSTLLSTCRLSRLVALKHIEDRHAPSWPRWSVFRSKGPLYRTRPMRVWEAQYRGDNEPAVDPHVSSLVPTIIGPLDLAVFRLHDSRGRARPTLRQATWQLDSEGIGAFYTLSAWFDRIGIEWHPLWATPEGREEFWPVGFEAIMSLMSCRSNESTNVYWLVDGVPRPNWKRDYPAIVPAFFNYWLAEHSWRVHKFQVGWSRETTDKFMADCNLGQEFEANGRRYYVVYVVALVNSYTVTLEEFKAVGLTLDSPFPGGEDIWPQALRAPARFAHEMLDSDDYNSLGADSRISYILSWEPI